MFFGPDELNLFNTNSIPAPLKPSDWMFNEGREIWKDPGAKSFMGKSIGKIWS